MWLLNISQKQCLRICMHDFDAHCIPCMAIVKTKYWKKQHFIECTFIVPVSSENSKDISFNYSFTDVSNNLSELWFMN